MEVERENLVSLIGRAAIPEIAHGAGMRVSAASGITARIARVWAAAASPVNVIAVLFDVFVDVWMNRLARTFAITLRLVSSNREMFAALPFDAGPLNHVPEVRDDAHLGKELPMLVEVDSPRVASTLGKDFEDISSRMIAPDSGVHPLTFRGWSAWLAG